MARISAERYIRIRALVEDGKIGVGSPQHLDAIQWELNARNASPRDQRILKLAIQGYTHEQIAHHVQLTRSSVSRILRKFFGA